MNKFLNAQYTGAQIIGFLMVVGSMSYLFYAFLIWAISSSSYL